MNNRKKAGLEVAIGLVSLGGGYTTHVWFERWDLALVVTLALECFLHLIAFVWIYRHVLDKISEWVQVDTNPLLEIRRLKEDLEDLRDNTIPLAHLLPAPKDWPFDELFVDIVENFKRNTQLISQGSYTLQMEDIQEISLEVCSQMESGAFCTALEENLNIFSTPRGMKLLSEQYKAAERLADAQGTSTGFTRLYLFDDTSRISWPHFQLMRESHDHKIEVLIAKKGAVAAIFRRFDLQSRMDFGKWKGNLLMEIVGVEPERRLHVTKRDDDLKIANELIRELRSAAYTYPEFLAHFKAPVNVRLWSTEPEHAVHLEVPDGPDEVDCDNIFRIATNGNHSLNRVAIYGLTKKLIDKATDLAEKPKSALRGIDVIDARHFAPQRKLPSLSFIRANWMDWNPGDYKYDAIVADDVLCNLTYWQTPLFFEQVAKILNPGGLFVFRTTAKFSPGLVNPTWEDLVAELQLFDGTQPDLSLDLLSAGAVYEMVWPTLHTDRFYDGASRSLSFGVWNDVVTRDTRLSVNLRNHLTFRRPLQLTSMEYQDLRSQWLPHFKVAQAELPAISRWETDKTLAAYSGAKEIARRFHDYYRVVVLQKER